MLKQSFDFLVNTYKTKPELDDNPESAAKEIRLSKAGTVEERFAKFKQDNFSDANPYSDYVTQVLYTDKELVRAFMSGLDNSAVKAKEQKKEVDLKEIAGTIRDIQLGKRKYHDTQSALSLCKEMFDAGYHQAEE